MYGLKRFQDLVLLIIILIIIHIEYILVRCENSRQNIGRFSRQNRRNLNLHCVLVDCLVVGSSSLPRLSVSLTCNTTTMSNGHRIQQWRELFSLSSFSSLPSRQHIPFVIFLFYWIFGTESSTKRGTYQSFTHSNLLKRQSSKIILYCF